MISISTSNFSTNNDVVIIPYSIQTCLSFRNIARKKQHPLFHILIDVIDTYIGLHNIIQGNDRL